MIHADHWHLMLKHKSAGFTGCKNVGLLRRSDATCKPAAIQGFTMQCRKCGRKCCNKREAGLFSCRRCGVQPGQLGYDRGGIPEARHFGPAIPPPDPLKYEFTPRQPRLKAGSQPQA